MRVGVSIVLGLGMAVAGAQEPATTPPAHIYLTVIGSDRALRTGSWERLKGHFKDQLNDAARGREQVILLAGSAQPPKDATGTLVNVYVLTYFYVSPWVRDIPIGGGRQAILNATVKVRDLRTGRIVAENFYDKVSSRNAGTEQEVTEMQVRAIVEDIVKAARSPLPQVVPVAATPAAPPPAVADRNEVVFWESVRDSRNPAELQAYIDEYPNGTFVALAKARLAALGRK